MAMHNPTQMFFITCIALFRNDIWLCEKNKLFITIFITIHWVKPAWPAEMILLTATLLMGPCRATPAKQVSPLQLRVF